MLVMFWFDQAMVRSGFAIEKYLQIHNDVSICVLVGNLVNVDICGDSEGAGGAAGQLM